MIQCTVCLRYDVSIIVCLVQEGAKVCVNQLSTV